MLERNGRPGELTGSCQDPAAARTDSNGSPEWTYDYEPYGTTLTATQLETAAPANPLRFTGELLDPNDYYYLRARQYDSQNGTFQRTDPMEPSVEAPYISPYVYVANRLTVMVDPSGETYLPSSAGRQVAQAVVAPAEAWRGSMDSAHDQPTDFCWRCVPGALYDGVTQAHIFMWEGYVRGVIDNPGQAASSAVWLVAPESAVLRIIVLIARTDKGLTALNVLAGSKVGPKMGQRMLKYGTTPQGSALIGRRIPPQHASGTFPQQARGRLNSGDALRIGIGRHPTGQSVFRISVDRVKALGLGKNGHIDFGPLTSRPLEDSKCTTLFL